MMKFTIPGQLLLLCPKRIKLTSSIYGSKLANYSFDTQCVGNQDVSDDRQQFVAALMNAIEIIRFYRFL